MAFVEAEAAHRIGVRPGVARHQATLARHLQGAVLERVGEPPVRVLEFVRGHEQGPLAAAVLLRALLELGFVWLF
jgi:hypothetical protein